MDKTQNIELESQKIRFEVGTFSDKGNKSVNEDAFVVFEDLSKFTKNNNDFPFRKHFYSFFAIYDGHGGDSTANYLRDHLHHNLVEELLTVKDFSIDSNVESPEHINYIKNVLVNTFVRTDKEIIAMLKKSGNNDGSTAVVVLLVDNVAWVANVGDSKAILVREKIDKTLKIGHLSKDHNPNYLDERRRIERSGGFVRNGRVLDKLSVSRSFGDPTLKQYGVNPVPYISRVLLNPVLDEFLLLSCDGLFSRMTVTQVAEHTLKLLRHFSAPDSKSVSKDLIKEAVIDREASDNVTVILVKRDSNQDNVN